MQLSKKTYVIIGVVCLVLGLVVGGFMLYGQGNSIQAGGTKEIEILQTSDVHGMTRNFDYSLNEETKGSLANAYTLIKQEREKNPNVLLVDSGDTTQANYIQAFQNETPNPMIDAMNFMKYDVWTLGNHEFNFSFDNLEKEISEFKGQVLAGNIYKSDNTRFQDAYKIFDVDGVKVAIFGLDAPNIPEWEKSDSSHYNDMKFTAPIDETGKILDELEGKADVIIGSIHYGLDGEMGYDGCKAIAEKYGSRMNALLIGHAHQEVDEEIGGIPVLEPGCNGEDVSKLSIKLSTNSDGTYKVESVEGELLKTEGVEEDKDFLEHTSKLDEESRALANTKVGEVGATFIDSLEDLPGIPNAIIKDNAVLDLINKIQLQEAGADVSCAALFQSSSNLEKGPFLDRDSVKIYKYDNTLFGVKVTGKKLKEIMEKYAGNFFNQYKEGDVTISFNPDIRMYMYDEFAGVNYDINISKPEGSRIENLSRNGEPIADGQELILALNNYRYGNLVSDGLVSEDDVVYQGGAIRDMITEYVKGLTEPLMPECDNNWKITGANLDDADKDKIYEKVKSGEITIPTSEDGRTPNVKSLNANELRKEGKI